MKRFLSLILALALLLGSASFALADEPTIVRIVWWGNQARHDNTVIALEKFMEKNPDIKVEYEFADWGGYWSKLATQVAGGMVPDVIQMDTGYLIQYSENGVLENLNPYVENETLDVNNMSATALSTGMIGDGLYAIPTGLSTKVLVYRKDVLDSLGLTMPMEPTVSEIVELCRKVFEATGRTTKYTWAGYADGLRSFLRNYGWDLYNADNTGLGFDDPKCIARNWELYQLGLQEGWILQPGTETAVNEQASFIQDTWLFTIPVNQIGQFETGSDCELEIAVFPALDDATHVATWLQPTMYWSLSADSQVKDAAIKLINYLNHDLDCADILGTDRGLPVATDVVEYLTPSLDAASQKFAAAMTFFAQDGKTRPAALTPAVHAELSTLYGEYTEQVQYGLVDDLNAHALAWMEEAKAIFERANAAE